MKDKKKLSLSKESIRVLKSAELFKVAGGSDPTNTCDGTRDCTLPPG